LGGDGWKATGYQCINANLTDNQRWHFIKVVILDVIF